MAIPTEVAVRVLTTLAEAVTGVAAAIITLAVTEVVDFQAAAEVVDTVVEDTEVRIDVVLYDIILTFLISFVGRDRGGGGDYGSRDVERRGGGFG